MGYTLVKGGGEAIRAAEELAGKTRLAGTSPIVNIPQIKEQMSLAVDQVMGEGSLYCEEIGALAVKQAEGDLMEASFLVRAYRTTLPRLGYSIPCDTDMMSVIRRVSSAFKDVPGGQILGATHDYTPHLLDFTLLKKEARPAVNNEVEINKNGQIPFMTRVADILREEGLISPRPERCQNEPFDITRDAMSFPAPRTARLQALARGESGAMLCLAYSSLRGFGFWHPTIAELRVGYVSLKITHPYTQAEVSIGRIRVTECESLNGSSKTGKDTPKLAVGYGLVFGHNERKSISMSILDGTTGTADGGGHSIRASEDEEFVFYHIDAIDAMGFVEHLKLPHYVDFQSALNQARERQSAWVSKVTVRT